MAELRGRYAKEQRAEDFEGRRLMGGGRCMGPVPG